MTTVPSSPPDPPDPLVVRIADRVRREVVLARFIGKLVVDQGLRELRERVLPAETAPMSRTADVVPVVPVSVSNGPPVDAGEVAVGELALADYDHLSSAQIVAKLTGLEPSERAEIGVYERAHRHRRTILGKLEQFETT